MLTPCVNVCKLTTDTNQCIGCFRYADEIADWIHLTEDQRSDIMVKLKERKNEEEKKGQNSLHSICPK